VLQRSTGIDPDGAPSRREYGECDHAREKRRGPNVWQRIEHIDPDIVGYYEDACDRFTNLMNNAGVGGRVSR
jgi:hypothetical protein